MGTYTIEAADCYVLLAKRFESSMAASRKLYASEDALQRKFDDGFRSGMREMLLMLQIAAMQQDDRDFKIFSDRVRAAGIEI